MNNSNQNDDLVNYLCASIFEMQGRLKANEVISNSLLKVVCENAPQLIEQIKETITGLSELSLTMNELSEGIASNTFQNEIQQSILRFSLIRESANYSPTHLEVKVKF